MCVLILKAFRILLLLLLMLKHLYYSFIFVDMHRRRHIAQYLVFGVRSVHTYKYGLFLFVCGDMIEPKSEPK